MAVCCCNCFEYEYVQEFIDKNGELGDCSFCGTDNTKCIAPKELAGIFSPLVSLYTAVEDFMPMHDLKSHDGDMLHEKLQNDWGVFSNDGFSEELVAAILHEDPYSGDHNPLLHSYVEREDLYWGVDDEFTAELETAWKAFSDEITYRNRFFPNSPFDIGILDSLLPILSEEVAVHTPFYRARNSFSGPAFPINEMGKPPADKSRFGRANPSGISYLYLTADPYTAVREIRPSIDDKITIGLFLTIHACKVIDLTNPRIKCPFSLGDRLDATVQCLGFLRKLATEISKPVDTKAAELEYVPLQYLCEYFKNRGFDGIRFKSSLTTGINTTLFNDHVVECIESNLWRINVDPEKIR